MRHFLHFLLMLPMLLATELTAVDSQYNTQEEATDITDIIHDESDKFLRKVDDKLERTPRNSSTSRQFKQVKENINLIRAKIDPPTRYNPQQLRKRSKKKK